MTDNQLLSPARRAGLEAGAPGGLHEPLLILLAVRPRACDNLF